MTEREQLKQEILRVRAEIEAVIDAAQPRGLWERIAGVDEARMQEAEDRVLQLRAELSIYEDTWKELAAAEPQVASPTPTPASPPAEPPPGVAMSPELLALAVRRRDAQELMRELRSLARTVRELESVARVTHRKPTIGGGGGRWASDLREAQASVERQRQSRDARTGDWDNEAASANLLAHRLGIVLELPRRRLSSAELAVGATSCVPVGSDDLSDHIMAAGPALDEASDAARELIAAIDAQEPAAAAIPPHLLPAREKVVVPDDGMPAQAFLEQWRELLKVHTVLERLRSQGASRPDLLGPLTRWQQQAQSLREGRGERTPVPPLNQGMDLHAFVASLTAHRAGWEAELDALEAEEMAKEQAALHRPEAVAAARQRFRASWEELLRLGAAVATTKASGAPVLELGRAVKAWDTEATRAVELAERYGFEPVPLRFDNEDLRRFTAELEQRMPGWKAALI